MKNKNETQTKKLATMSSKRCTAMLQKALENILQDCKGGKSYEHLGLKDKFFDSIEENALDAIFALDTLGN